MNRVFPNPSLPHIARIFVLLLMMLRPSVAGAQEIDEADILQWTVRVGQMLHHYYEAFDVASAAVADRGELPPLFAGGPYDGGWAFSFGDFEPDSTFILDYGVILDPDHRIVSFEEFDFRRVASVHHTLAARALAVARDDFTALSDSAEYDVPLYRFAVLPFPEHHLTAFISPAQTCPDHTHFGNALMYRQARGSGEIRQRTRLHHRLIILPADQMEGAMPLLMVPDAPLPSPLDVVNVMEYGSPVLVHAGRGSFVLHPNGSIHKLDGDAALSESLKEYEGDLRHESAPE